MKHFRGVLFLLAVLAAADAAEAQYGQPQRTTAERFGAGFYLRGGTMTATGDYSSLPDQTGTVHYSQTNAQANLNSGFGAGKGYYGELGRLSYLGLPLPNVVRVGIDASVSAGYMNVEWGEIYGVPQDETLEQTGELVADAKIGPAVSVMPLPGLKIDAALKFGVGAVGGSSVYISDYPVQSGFSVQVDDSHDEFATGSSRAFTLAVRYAGFTVGWETNSMSVERYRSYSAYRSDGREGAFTYLSTISPSTTRMFIGFAR